MPPAAGPLTLPFQTLYAELLEQCALDAFDQAFPEAGTFTAKEIRGKRYWYFQLPAAAGQKQQYVGPETAELLERIRQHRQARQAEGARRSLVSTLVRSAGLPRPLPRIGEIVAALAKAGVFRLRGVLVGTIAYQTYPGLIGVRLPAASLQTGDVDIAQFSNVSAAVEDATVPMLSVLRAVDDSFRAVPHTHDSRRSVTYLTADKVRVDFLTPNQGPETDKPRRLPAFGTDAEPLRFLDFLIHAPEPAVVLHGAGVYVLVPSPERYAVHKLIVAQRRAGPRNVKRAKDVAQAEALLDRLAETKPTELRAVWREAQARSRKWSEYVYAGLADVGGAVRDRTLAAVGEVRAKVPGLALKLDRAAAREDRERDGLLLWATAAEQRVRCLVTRKALEDNYGGDLQGHRPEVEALLQDKFLHDPVEEPGTVVLETADVPRLRRRAKASPRRART